MSLTSRIAFNPSIQRVTARYWYPFFTRLGGANDVFLNMGYEEDPPMALPLAASDEPDRLFINLYHRTATQADLTGKRVLEVSCGHGGGASYLMRSVRPASYTGLDLNQAAIEVCRKRHNLPGLDFVQGNADNLPFADQSFDAVINIEASHCYPSLPRFLGEVARVLCPGGDFLYADIRRRDNIAEWEAVLADAPMRMLSQTDITAQVLRVMKLQDSYTRNQDRLSDPMPAFLRGLARHAVRAVDSKMSQGLQNGEFSFRIYRFAKD